MIISSTDDYSTNDVIDWLRYYSIKFIRISIDDEIRYESVTINNTKLNINFSINNVNYCLSDFTAFWYRRSHFNVFIQKITSVSDKTLSVQINKHIQSETIEIHKLLVKYISTRSINTYNDIHINKLELLNYAAKIGLKIPDTLITNSKEEVLHFTKKHQTVITKNFSQGVFLFNKSRIFNSITRVVNEEIYNMLPEKFSYTLFQEGIEKLFELRIFYLNGKFYSSAIFSQNDEQTAIDFRNYNFFKPNRTPPFTLPNEMKTKLKKIMNEFRLNSGSIDVLVSTENEFIFLEVNPIGQFGQVSVPCNYFLEEKIALELIKIQKNGIIKNRKSTSFHEVR